MVYPHKATSRKSDAILDFGITHNKKEWNAEVLDEATSDHRPILFKSPYCADEGSFFRRTNWNIFSFFLTVVFEYWNTLVYNLDVNSFIELFSLFLSALWDRCSFYDKVDKFRPPWPPHLVLLAREVNKCRRRYRRTRLSIHLERFLNIKRVFVEERFKVVQQKRDKNMSWISENQNIWKYSKTSITEHPSLIITLSY